MSSFPAVITAHLALEGELSVITRCRRSGTCRCGRRGCPILGLSLIAPLITPCEKKQTLKQTCMPDTI